MQNAGTAIDAAKAFAAGTADLAIVRADVGDLQQARTVAITAQGVVMIVAPPGSSINSIAKLKGHTVGVVGGEINHGVVDALKKEYDLGDANVTFKDIATTDARRAVQAKDVSALLLVVPLTDKYLSYVKGLFQSGTSSPVLIEIDSAGAITDGKGPYESFDIPKGTLRGAPPVPDDDTTTLRVSYYLVANRHLDPQPDRRTDQKVHGRPPRPCSVNSRCCRGYRRPKPIPTLSSPRIRVRPPTITAPRKASWTGTATPSI